eukprot:COSAG02_NODE_907_length_16005_cov_3.219252_3_plen_244_part_00
MLRRSSMLALLVFYHLTAAVGAPKLSSFRKKTETPPGAHVVNDGSAGVRGPAAAAALPSVRADSHGAGKLRTFAPAEEFEANLAEAKRRAKQGGKQATQARADANEHLESLVTAAEQLQSVGDLAGAGIAFDRALEAEPTSPRALANRAKVHYDLKELESAERLYRKSLVAHPVDPSAWLNLALVQLRRGLHLSDARMHAERALSLLRAKPQAGPAQQMLTQALGVLDAIHAAEAKAAAKDEL